MLAGIIDRCQTGFEGKSLTVRRLKTLETELKPCTLMPQAEADSGGLSNHTANNAALRNCDPPVLDIIT